MMKNRDITTLISIIHRLVHKRLTKVASAVYVQDNYLNCELMFHFNGRHASVYRRYDINKLLNYDVNTIADDILDGLLYDMEIYMINSYKRKTEEE